MQRSITGFCQDEEQDWVALLDCHHRQHTRHRPPLSSRPWVLTHEGRAAHIGALLDCLRCDRFELPEDLHLYRRTATFRQDTLPDGLRANHTTRPGVWGRIVVEEGALRYIAHPSAANAAEPAWLLQPGVEGVVVPQMPHRIELLDDVPVRFFVAFYRPLAPAVQE